MKSLMPFLLMILAICVGFNLASIDHVFAQEDKGDLDDFADDYGDDDSDDSDDAVEFFLLAVIENIGDITALWGRTPETEFGPYPSFPYAGEEGFMSTSPDFRSYFFNTEFSYNYLNSDLRNYTLKWETQFAGTSKLSFDLSVYDERRYDKAYGSYRDRLTLMGVRYGYAFFRSPQMMVNLEGGFRGLYKNRSHGGPELALDMQLFPKKPLIIQMELSAAWVSGEPLYIVESSAGIAIGRYEILGGMRILKNGSGDMLEGFRVGLRVWY